MADSSGLPAVATRFVFTGTSLWRLIATSLSSLPVYNLRQCCGNLKEQNLCSHHMESFRGFSGSGTCPQVQQQLCFLGLKSHPVEGYSVEHSICKTPFSHSRFLFCPTLSSCLVWRFFQGYLDSFMLSTKQQSTWGYVKVFQTPTCCIFLGTVLV